MQALRIKPCSARTAPFRAHRRTQTTRVAASAVNERTTFAQDKEYTFAPIINVRPVIDSVFDLHGHMLHGPLYASLALFCIVLHRHSRLM